MDGSSPDPCLTGSSTIPSNERSIFGRTFPRTLSWNTPGRSAAGFTFSTSCRQLFSTALHSGTAWCTEHFLRPTARRCRSRLKNYTDPLELMDRYGADSVRMYLLASAAVQTDDLSFRDDGVETVVRSILLPLWNALSFFSSYAAIDKVSPKDLAWSDSFEFDELGQVHPF